MKKIILISAVLISFFAISCKNKEAEAFNKIEKDVFFVKAENPQIRTISNEIVLGASIKAMEEAVIYPRINGKLTENVLKEGDSVSKDQTIAYVKKDEVGVVYEPAPIPSTIDGVIGRIYQDPGADVNIQTPIALVVNQKKIRIQMDMPEKYLSGIYKGQKVSFKVETYPDKVFSAKIEKISPVVDKVSKTSLVEAVADNSSGYLKSGMFCEARVALKEVDNAYAVPLSAIVYKEKVPYIYVLDESGHSVKEVKASLGISDSQYAQVKNINLKDKIITVGLYGIYDKAKVYISEND
ncbi:MAG: efflux RND transporter periplasmic adaptor subunit [Elusimicrobiota bacterium]